MGSKFNVKNLGDSLLSDNAKEMVVNEFQITYVPIENIIPNENNEGFSMEEIEELKTSIKEIDLEQNLVVVAIGDDKYKLLTGHRRLEALNQLYAEGYDKYKNVPCKVKNLDKLDLPLSTEGKELYALATTNIENRKLTAGDKLKLKSMLDKVYDELQQQHYPGLGKRREFISERLGISQGSVQILQNIDKNISDDFRADVEAGNIPITVANEIASIPIKEQKKLAKKNLPIDELTLDTVKNFKEKSEGKNKEKSKSSEISEYSLPEYHVTHKTIRAIEDGIAEISECVNSEPVISPGDYDRLQKIQDVLINEINKIKKILSI